MENTVSSKWLNDNVNNPDLVVLDASFNRSGVFDVVDNRRILNARFFDLKKAFRDQSSDFPNTVPSPKDFEASCRSLGINSSSTIVVYDNIGVYTSPRVWWMFKMMGHDKIAILDGGLLDWIQEGFETMEIGVEENEEGVFNVNYRDDWVRSIKDIKGNIESKNAQVVDVRSSDRFCELVPEPRENLRTGQIPFSINLHYKDVLSNGKYKPKKELKELFDSMDIADKSLIFSCGSGITACIVFLAADMVLDRQLSLYDGSWTEWGTLVEKGGEG